MSNLSCGTDLCGAIDLYIAFTDYIGNSANVAPLFHSKLGNMNETYINHTN